MKNSKIILIYSVIATLILSIFLFIIFIKQSNNANIKTNFQQSEQLFKLKNKYIGNASGNSHIIEKLGVAKAGEYTTELKTSGNSNILVIAIKPSKAGTTKINALSYQQYGIVLLALIENCNEIQWYLNADVRTLNEDQEKITITVENTNKEYGNIKDYGKSSEKLHLLLTNLGYYKESEK